MSQANKENHLPGARSAVEFRLSDELLAWTVKLSRDKKTTVSHMLELLLAFGIRVPDELLDKAINIMKEGRLDPTWAVEAVFQIERFGNGPENSKDMQ